MLTRTSFYPLLLNSVFKSLKKGEKLAKGVNKLVGKVSVNILCHTSHTVSCLHNQHNYQLLLVSTCIVVHLSQTKTRAVVGGPAGPAMAGSVLGHTKFLI